MTATENKGKLLLLNFISPWFLSGGDASKFGNGLPHPTNAVAVTACTQSHCHHGMVWAISNLRAEEYRGINSNLLPLL